MDANEPREQAAGGWTQFGDTPPTAGGFPRREPAGPALPPPPPPRRPGFLLTRKAIAGLAVAAAAALGVTALGGGAVGAYLAGADRPVAAASASAPSPVFRSVADQLTVAEVAAKVQPSVVMIQGRTAEGSGVVLSEDGLILTNNHVVSGQGDVLTVKFNDGRTAKASVVGTDPATDLAVIRAEGVKGLAKATLGDSDQLKVGDDVLAVGSPLGLDGTVTAGIVSALDRTVTAGDGGGGQQFPWGQQQQTETTTLGGMIQTDAAINPGNSGGALVNAAGELVGINSAVSSEGVNLGFAIPVNTAKQVSQQLISKGKVSHAFLGVSVTDATGDVPGALIRQVSAGSPADKAGLKQGDLITRIGDTKVDGGDTVVGQVRGFTVGQQVRITYLRDGKENTVTATMQQQK
ncbi:trypsin-like peptidase domain-containing protein [Actinomadura sp. ATCC 31491]|uniref:Trypsin-like peptidase domain-containing protein n=1 Tax=Actinomadura luzonensis TaxID=2805427 RepID=A0ABT0FPD7_9ACTN|nr:trypsin-like peptidase domain-containing protein [Actinomadura luzonensis]MCK2213781.1 trypsin-like peptidase domain-containing protein [Actinomadura luzonensis]